MIIDVGSVPEHHEHQIGNRAKHRAVARLGLAEGLFGPLPIGDVAADTLELDAAVLLVEDRVVDPVMPADRAIGQRHLVLMGIHAAADVRNALEHGRPGVRRNKIDELRSEQLLAALVEEATVRVVDERQRRIGQEPADQIALRVDDTPVPRFVVARLLFRAAAPHALNEKTDDQRELGDEDHRAADHVRPVQLEERLRTEHDDTARRDARVRNPPALQLPPIEQRRVRRDAGRNVARARAVRDPPHHVRYAPGVRLVAPDVPTHDSSNARVDRLRQEAAEDQYQHRREHDAHEGYRGSGLIRGASQRETGQVLRVKTQHGSRPDGNRGDAR